VSSGFFLKGDFSCKSLNQLRILSALFSQQAEEGIEATTSLKSVRQVPEGRCKPVLHDTAPTPQNCDPPHLSHPRNRANIHARGIDRQSSVGARTRSHP
jgi:hypothetical protein